MFYSNFEHQLYLEAVNVKKFRVAITKLRVSSHWLETEVEGGLDPTGHQSMKGNADIVTNLKMSFIF